MKKRTPLTDDDGEVRELDSDDIKRFKRADDVLPEQVQRSLGIKTRGPQRLPTKVATTIRLSPEVSEAFKATGPGWQTRIDNALKDWLKTHSLSRQTQPRG
jgi:uncharacterized protein (DUF4415 family)